MYYFYLFCCFVFGAILGSFSLAMAQRVVSSKDLYSRSCCDTCSMKLKWYDLIPLLSYVILKGKCRSCHSPIGRDKIFIEIVMAILILIIGAIYQDKIDVFFVLTFIITMLMIMSVVDILTLRVNDLFQIVILLGGILYVYMQQFYFAERILNLFIIAISLLIVKYLYFYIRKRDGLGMGDVKLFSVLSIFFENIDNTVTFIMISGLAGAIMCVVFPKYYNKEFPFIPSISLAFYLVFALKEII